MARHARLARRVRARFERLRPRHVRLNRQPDGSEPDIAAWVSTCADIRAGATVDGRLYVERRPSRRELAVALLADVSASTDGWVSSNRRIVDVEKEALLVVCEALDALGDRYGIFAFSGEGADDVSVLTLKSFDEARSLAVERRIAALDSDRYTRMGASIRHVTAALGRERTSRRLLLILSDGKPNDVDVYEGRYGVEDTRQAVAEARRQGVTVFCLTVDREAPRYASRIFGRAGFAVLHKADELPVGADRGAAPTRAVLASEYPHARHWKTRAGALATSSGTSERALIDDGRPAGAKRARPRQIVFGQRNGSCLARSPPPRVPR